MKKTLFEIWRFYAYVTLVQNEIKSLKLSKLWQNFKTGYLNNSEKKFIIHFFVITLN